MSERFDRNPPPPDTLRTLLPQISDSIQTDPRQARGAALKQARRGSGLSARELVERVNARTPGNSITEHAIYSYESARVQLPREVAERVAEVLRVPLGGLLAGDPDFPATNTPARPNSTAAPSADMLRQPAPPARHPATPAPPAPAEHLDSAAQRSPVSFGADAPPEPGRWLAVRASLLSRAQEAHTAAEVLIRQLQVRRFQLPDPVIFTASFELLDTDLEGLVRSPEAAWLECREADRWHEPLKQTVATAAALRDAAMRAWTDLTAAAATGSAAAACGPAATALQTALGAFALEAGLVRKLAPHAD